MEKVGHTKKRKRLSKQSDDFRHSNLACAALGIVLQHWLVPNLQICIDGLESRLQPLREQLVSNSMSSIDFPLPSERHLTKTELSDKFLHKWRSHLFIPKRIARLPAILENVSIQGAAPPEFHNTQIVSNYTI